MRFVDWWFRDRQSGRLVVAQWPNAALWVFLVATATSAILKRIGPAGTDPAPSPHAASLIVQLGRGAHVVSMISIVVWAGDELLRGVNPWRRLLGAAVLAGEAVRLIG